ncbi:MAG: hypothetical protein KJ725_06720 [Gammaproteobacteria bacterium]|nr:hypothetical protein [Gammaproteobacteria bacterium]
MDIIKKFENIRVYNESREPSFHKPVMLLLALSYCYKSNERMINFSLFDKDFKKIYLLLQLKGNYENSYYPFGKLENDGLWEVESSRNLRRTSIGHLHKKELLEKNISGGFTLDVYKALKSDKDLILTIANYLANKYFSIEQRPLLSEALDLPISDVEIHSANVSDIKPVYDNNKFMDAIKVGESYMSERQNGYIAYLNSLHNITANSANALAESQALNSYFTEIYQPFPLVEDVYQALSENKGRVIVLTGHAGDGKSTVALDIFKRLKQLPEDKPLSSALSEREEINLPNGKVTIVKDMSELTTQQRLDWLTQGLTELGSWLFVSNTGPLINSLADYVTQTGGRTDIESDILACLDRPYENGNLAQHAVLGFDKELVILNMTRLDNVEIGAEVLTKMVKHSAWDQCYGCNIESHCPLHLNRNVLHSISETVEERVRWIYQRLTSYEQRLTLRQMVAHLALSLTGGMDCKEAHVLVKKTGEAQTTNNEALDHILFSEVFFGFRCGKPWKDAGSLRAITLTRRTVFGGPISVDFERQLLGSGAIVGMELPETIKGTQQRWHKRAAEATGIRYRFALRRMLYFFGQNSSPVTPQSEMFLSTFLQSPTLRDFNRWQNEGGLTLDNSEKRALLKRCLKVLLEIFSGFSSGQFESDDALYLTLRRPDRVVVQPTQLIVAKLDSQDFALRYDAARRVPKLVYKNGLAELSLSLPLLDYIHSRSLGQLGNELAPIHLAQLEWFRAELLDNTHTFPAGEIGLLRSGIDGKVKMHRFVIDEQKQELEKY